MEFLKKLFADGALTWEQFKEAVKDMKLVDLKQGEYVSKDKFENLLDEKNGLKEQLEERDGQLAELKKLDPEKLQNRIAELENDNSKAKEEFERKLHESKVNSAIDLALNKASAKNLKAVKALLNVDIEKAEFGEDGSLNGLSEIINGLRESDSYLFDDDSSSKGGFKGGEPSQSDPNPAPAEPKTYADFVKSLENK